MVQAKNNRSLVPSPAPKDALWDLAIYLIAVLAVENVGTTTVA